MLQKSLFILGLITLTYALFISIFNQNSMLHYYRQQDKLKAINQKLKQIEKKNENLNSYLKANPNKTIKDILLELGYIDKDEIVLDLKISEVPTITPIKPPSPFLTTSASIFVFFFFLFVVLGLMFKYQLRRNLPIKPELKHKLKSLD